MLGTVEPHHNHEAVLDALAALDSNVGVVVCGRRTVYSDFLLRYARERHLAARVDFIYELTPADLPALFRMARVFAYLPDVRSEASIVPVVEALRAGLPMVLSDTRLNREAAGKAAAYVNPEAPGRGRRGVGERPMRRSRGGRRCASANAAVRSFSRNMLWRNASCRFTRRSDRPREVRRPRRGPSSAIPGRSADSRRGCGGPAPG